MRTTANINIDIFNLINQAAMENHISYSEMIVILLKKMVDEIPEPIQMWRLIRYQERRPKNEWKTVHINFREDEYEYFLDLKKIFKKSISLIITEAAMKFLAIDIKEKIINIHPCNCYAILTEKINSVDCWKLFWGLPPDLMQIINSS